MRDGNSSILNLFYWRGDGKTKFSPILEVTIFQDGGSLVKEVYTTSLTPDDKCNGVEGVKVGKQMRRIDD